MAVTLIGTVANACDSATGFGTGATDSDIFIEPPSSIGVKTSNATSAFTTTSLTGGPYDFSSGGTEDGEHIVIWFNGLTPLVATTGMRIRVGNGTDTGEWNVGPPGGYTGGFVSLVVDTAADFDTIVAGTWTLAGNPAQLTAVSLLGGVIQTNTTIMGNFNNTLVDQFTIGLGVRADAGTVGTPNTFEIVRAADEDTNFWGWWTSRAGAFLGKGGLYLGPATGTATSVFSDSAAVVLFESAQVAQGFYDINIRGSNTTVDFDGCVIIAEDPAVARWSITLDGTSVPTFDDVGSLFQGFDVLTLQSGSTLDGTTLDNGNSIIQNGATITNCTILNANTADGVALIDSDNLANISNCEFNFSDGHAIEITDATGSPFTFTGNIFNNYGADGTNDAAIYNNSGADVTINIAGGGSTPTIRENGFTTTVNNNTSVTLTGMKDNSEVRVYDNAALASRVELAGIENATAGTTDNRSFTFSLGAGVVTNIVVYAVGFNPVYFNAFTIPSSDTSLPVSQQTDRTYENPL